MRNLIFFLTLAAVTLSSDQLVQAQGAGNALHFDGNDEVVVPDDPALSFSGTENLTIELWVQQISARSVFHILGKRLHCGGTINYQLARDTANQLHFGSQGIGVSAGMSLPLDVWTHLAVTYDGSTARFYVNGILRNTASGTLGGTNTHPLKFGHSGTCSPGTKLPGFLDEIRIWNTARSEEQIRAHQHRRLPGSEAGLVGYWRFDEADGQTTFDATGNGHDGTFGPSVGADGADPSRLIPSHAPLGTGSSTTQSINADGSVDFAGTDLAIDFNGVTAPNTVVVTQIENNPNVLPTGSDLYSASYWIVNRYDTGTIPSGDFTFSIAGILSSDLSHYQLYRRGSNSHSSWTQVATSASSIDLDNDTVTFSGVTCCSQFLVGFDDTALPVELTRFDALVNGRTVLLTWETASETNNAGFEVEERNATLEVWTPQAFVEGHGTTMASQTYHYHIDNLEPGTYRFRLKQIDYDGTFAYSSEVEVAIGLDEPFRLTTPYPHPLQEEAQFSLSIARQQQVEVAVFDVWGRRIQTLFAGEMMAHTTRALRLEGAMLPSGLYVLRAQGEHFTATRLLTVVR